MEDRLLWADGVSSVDSDKLTQYILRLAPQGLLSKLAVPEMTPVVARYNIIAETPITVKSELPDDLVPFKWILPEHYKYHLDLDEYLIKLGDRIEQDEFYESRVERLSIEIFLFKKLNLDEVLRMLIYVVDQLVESKSVWGVGRGSSCSSYLLFLLGLHEVDPVKYDIDVADFIREGN